MATEAQKRASAKYDKANTKTYALKLNLKTDADIVEFLADKPNVQGYLKQIIRRQIAYRDGTHG